MVEVPDTYLNGRKPEDFCAMHVRGDSMYPDFRDGDIVLVLKQNTMNHSDEIGVISYGDDEMTIKWHQLRSERGLAGACAPETRLTRPDGSRAPPQKDAVLSVSRAY